MRRFFCLLCLLGGPSFGSWAQRALLKPANTPRDLVRDSVNRFAWQVSRQATSVFYVVRYHDTGYYNENAQVGTVVWKAAGRCYARVFRPGEAGAEPTPRLPLDTLFAIYQQHRLSQLSDQVPPAKDGALQGPAYNVDLIVRDAKGIHTEGFNVRAPARHTEALVPGSKTKYVYDPRCAWLDLWEEVLP
ncbi:hypothetical protein [Hymenobacter canadensis]|uniref:Uncharacterized protein n=1 Tax=Hymenobacter canadensis TaxID=2999067 RepID=A0ABY7LWR8_9BACT|nr:hypothetical protein [Hymenobacter canadensis]WBA43981.1 hypothetical protein O3303_20670 [Hymenobacter canadensis]